MMNLKLKKSNKGINSINELLTDKTLEEKNAILDDVLLQKAKETYTIESAKEVVRDYLLKEEVPNGTNINRTLAIFYLDKIDILNEFYKEVEMSNKCS